MKTTILSFFVAAIMIMVSANSFSNNPNDEPGKKAVLTGKVVDQATGESLAGALVLIKGTDIKTYTDFEGNFTINNLEPGTYSVEVTFISYQQGEIINVTFSSGKSTLMEIGIIPE